MYNVKPIAYAFNERVEIEDDNWGKVETSIIIDEGFPTDSLDGIEAFSHVEIIYYFHKVDDKKIATGARHPRNDKALPKVGIFSQRGKNRPNKIGLTTVKFINRENRTLLVAGLDCIDGTPILDIKPVMREFLPKEPVTQPEWTQEIMRNYW